MPNSEPHEDLTESDRRLLEREKFKAQVRKLRSQYRKGDRVLRLLDSPWVTAITAALITVGLGGIIGGHITSSYQARLKEREIALATYKDFLGQRQETERRAYSLITTSLYATEDLILLTGGDFNPVSKDTSAEDIKRVMEQRFAMTRTFNEADRQWRVEGGVAGLAMSYYHEGSGEVYFSWAKAQVSVTIYMKCAEDWYSLYINDSKKTKDTSSACLPQRQDADQAVLDLTQSIEKTRAYPWREPGERERP